MKKKIGVLLCGCVIIFSLSGCATWRKQKNTETQEFKNQVSLLESQMQSKDEEISGLKEELARAQQERTKTITIEEPNLTIPEVKSRPSVKQIQDALSNAGYNPGEIDGKKGRQTKDAIRAFQRAHGLAVDGKVGKKTWELLKEYLDKRVK